ncbi:unnamed protein product, partial [Discosporangium mesarthrocarpum]
FDVLVAGHITRLGTKQDVKDTLEFYGDVIDGTLMGLSTVPDVSTGTGVGTPGNPNFGNVWWVGVSV